MGVINGIIQHGRTRNTSYNIIRAIAEMVVNRRPVHFTNFGGGGQVIVLKSAITLMCAESNERLKVVAQLFTSWWNRPT